MTGVWCTCGAMAACASRMASSETSGDAVGGFMAHMYAVTLTFAP